MLARLTEKQPADVTPVLSTSFIPLPTASADIAVSANAIIEIHQFELMVAAFGEIGRILRPQGQFYLLTSNPLAVGHNYASFSYPTPTTPDLGSLSATEHTIK